MQKTNGATEGRPWLPDLNFIVGCIAAGLIALLLHGLFSHVLDAHFHAGKVVQIISWLCFYLAPTILLLLLKPAKGKVPDKKSKLPLLVCLICRSDGLPAGWQRLFIALS